MYVVWFLLFAISLTCDATPLKKLSDGLAPSFGKRGVDHYIIGGINAQPGAWPWQLSLQAYDGTYGWYHTCGASLLSSTNVLTAAHCVDGRTPSIMRVIAGLYRRSILTGTQTVGASSISMHERYELDESLGSTSNDIAVITLSSRITTNSNIQYANLPPNNLDNFAGKSCTLTGWGRTSISSTLPDILQQVSMPVITTQDCSQRMQSISGVVIWDNHICVYNTAQSSGSCNGDSGGPMNCPNIYGGYYVAGVTSWGISRVATGECLQSYPSVYTRTSAYLNWIFSQ